MKNYSENEINKAIKQIRAAIVNCEKMIDKFNEGSSQHSLLTNRIKALRISESLLSDEEVDFTRQELQEALAPIESIINKSKTGISNFQAGQATYTRFNNLINSMTIAKETIQDYLEKI